MSGDMRWFTLLAALVGGLLGGAIPGAMTYLGWRREQRARAQTRRWQDAEVIADARSLLTDIEPMRVAENVDPAPGAEKARWEDLIGRRDDVRRRLLVISGGHPAPAVRSSAQTLESQLFSAAILSAWLVDHRLKKRDDAEHRARAKEGHESAVAACAQLERAVTEAGG